MGYFKPEPSWDTVEDAMAYVLRARNGIEQLTDEKARLRDLLDEVNAELTECRTVLEAAREFVKVTI